MKKNSLDNSNNHKHPTYSNNYNSNSDLKAFADATWDYIVEHCDITDSGALFVKFHTHGRAQFERRIMSRIKGYHREDVELKQEKAELTKEQHIENKKKRHARYEWNKKKGRILLRLSKFVKLFTKLFTRHHETTR